MLYDSIGNVESLNPPYLSGRTPAALVDGKGMLYFIKMGSVSESADYNHLSNHPQFYSLHGCRNGHHGNLINPLCGCSFNKRGALRFVMPDYR
jgi:hypothetical protein